MQSSSNLFSLSSPAMEGENPGEAIQVEEAAPIAGSMESFNARHAESVLENVCSCGENCPGGNSCLSLSCSEQFCQKGLFQHINDVHSDGLSKPKKITCNSCQRISDNSSDNLCHSMGNHRGELDPNIALLMHLFNSNISEKVSAGLQEESASTLSSSPFESLGQSSSSFSSPLIKSKENESEMERRSTKCQSTDRVGRIEAKYDMRTPLPIFRHFDPPASPDNSDDDVPLVGPPKIRSKDILVAQQREEEKKTSEEKTTAQPKHSRRRTNSHRWSTESTSSSDEKEVRRPSTPDVRQSLEEGELVSAEEDDDCPKIGRQRRATKRGPRTPPENSPRGPTLKKGPKTPPGSPPRKTVSSITRTPQAQKTPPVISPCESTSTPRTPLVSPPFLSPLMLASPRIQQSPIQIPPESPPMRISPDQPKRQRISAEALHFQLRNPGKSAEETFKPIMVQEEPSEEYSPDVRHQKERTFWPAKQAPTKDPSLKDIEKAGKITKRRGNKDVLSDLLDVAGKDTEEAKRKKNLEEQAKKVALVQGQRLHQSGQREFTAEQRQPPVERLQPSAEQRQQPQRPSGQSESDKDPTVGRTISVAGQPIPVLQVKITGATIEEIRRIKNAPFPSSEEIQHCMASSANLPSPPAPSPSALSPPALILDPRIRSKISATPIPSALILDPRIRRRSEGNPPCSSDMMRPPPPNLREVERILGDLGKSAENKLPEETPSRPAPHLIPEADRVITFADPISVLQNAQKIIEIPVYDLSKVKQEVKIVEEQPQAEEEQQAEEARLEEARPEEEQEVEEERQEEDEEVLQTNSEIEKLEKELAEFEAEKRRILEGKKKEIKRLAEKSRRLKEERERRKQEKEEKRRREEEERLRKEEEERQRKAEEALCQLEEKERKELEEKQKKRRLSKLPIEELIEESNLPPCESSLEKVAKEKLKEELAEMDKEKARIGKKQAQIEEEKARLEEVKARLDEERAQIEEEKARLKAAILKNIPQELFANAEPKEPIVIKTIPHEKTQSKAVVARRRRRSIEEEPRKEPKKRKEESTVVYKESTGTLMDLVMEQEINKKKICKRSQPREIRSRSSHYSSRSRSRSRSKKQRRQRSSSSSSSSSDRSTYSSRRSDSRSPVKYSMKSRLTRQKEISYSSSDDEENSPLRREEKQKTPPKDLLGTGPKFFSGSWKEI